MQLNWNKLLSTKRRLDSIRIKGDRRSEFERDYDSSLFSTPVRRLQDKAQVFPLESNDSIRTRLTHSLEVSSIARTLGNYCAPFIIKSAKLSESRHRDIEMICQTCGLLHDVGNPPFGHAGEEAIVGWFKQKMASDSEFNKQISTDIDGNASQKINDFYNFDGNPQSFRILTRLQITDTHYGLNLTCAILAGLLKYTAGSNQINKNVARLKKVGFFFSEEKIVEFVQAETGLQSFRHPLTYLIEAADDIAYSVIDIEDALKKQVINWDTLLKPSFSSLRNYLKRAEKEATNAGLGPETSSREHVYCRLRKILIAELVASITRSFITNYSSIMDGSITEPLEKLCDRKDVFSACKKIAREHIYFSKDTLKLEIMGRKVVSDLMNLFWEGVANYKNEPGAFHFQNKIWEMLSVNYRNVYQTQINSGKLNVNGELDYYNAFHLVTDHVCGMTDTFACRLHRELFNGH